jgi:RHS repeat-associated protein
MTEPAMGTIGLHSPLPPLRSKRGRRMAGGETMTMTYDATGLRRKRQDSSGTTDFVWDLENLLMEVSGGTQARYTTGLGTYGPVLSQRRGGTSHFLLADAIGTTTRLLDASENVTDTYIMDAFGDPVANSGSSVNPFRYVGGLGYYHEADASLNYVRARWLRPTTGSWLSVDPVEGEARYQYVGHSPVMGVDASGSIPSLRELAEAYQEYYITDPLTEEFTDPGYSPWDCLKECLRERHAWIPAVIGAVGGIAGGAPIPKRSHSVWDPKLGRLRKIPKTGLPNTNLWRWLPKRYPGLSGKIPFPQLDKWIRTIGAVRIGGNPVVVTGLQIVGAAIVGWEIGLGLSCWAKCS